jgi:hypothetical protein
MNSEPDNQPARKGRLWPWFVIGFLIVFVGLALAVTMLSLHPSGRYVVSCKLWQYYVLEFRKWLNSSGNLGPTTGNDERALLMLCQHVLFSLAGGAAALAIGWVVRKVRGKPRGTT